MIPLRKHQIFYKQSRWLGILNIHHEGNLYKFFENLLMFRDDYLWVIHAYMYRIEKIRTRKEASIFIINVFKDYKYVGIGIQADIVYRKNIPRIRKILDMYGPPVEIKINNSNV